MKRPARSTFRYYAKQAYVALLTRGQFAALQVINGMTYQVTIDLDERTVFFDWKEQGQSKTTTVQIAKCWIGA